MFRSFSKNCGSPRDAEGMTNDGPSDGRAKNAIFAGKRGFAGARPRREMGRGCHEWQTKRPTLPAVACALGVRRSRSDILTWGREYVHSITLGLQVGPASGLLQHGYS